MGKKQYKYSDITEKIIGCAMRVHSKLGNGFQEVIYQRALEVEFRDSGLNFEREHKMHLSYKNQTIGTRRVDFLVEKCIMVELKAIAKLDNTNLAQVLNYLESYNLEIGLLINFGTKSLEFKRVINGIRQSAKSKSVKSEKSAVQTFSEIH